MGVRLEDLYFAREVIVQLAQNTYADGTVTYRIARNIDKMNRLYDSLDKAHKALVMEYGEAVDGPDGTPESGGWRVKEESREAFNERFQELLAEPVDTKFIKLFPEHAAHLNFLTPVQMNLIFFLFEEDGGQEPGQAE